MRYLNLEEVLELRRMILQQSGGMPGLRDFQIADLVADAYRVVAPKKLVAALDATP